jgi:hypothetical protein
VIEEQIQAEQALIKHEITSLHLKQTNFNNKSKRSNHKSRIKPNCRPTATETHRQQSRIIRHQRQASNNPGTCDANRKSAQELANKASIKSLCRASENKEA